MTKRMSNTTGNNIPVTVTFRHLDSSNAMREYAEAGVGRLARFINNPLKAQVVLAAGKKNRHIAEISLLSDGLTVTGHSESTDLMASIDGALDKIDIQLRKTQDKRGDHKAHPRRRPGNSNHAQTEYEVEEATGETLPPPKIVHREAVDSKPRTPEDAALELEASDKPFVVFRDIKTESLCVLYRMKDGNLGLIEH